MLRVIGILTCVLALSRSAAAEPRACVVLAGDDALVGDVHAELVARKIEMTSGNSCATVTLTTFEGLIVVDVVDPAGRNSRRTVAKVGEAVSVIESWARPELAADLITGFTIEPAEVPAPPPTVPPPAVVTTAYVAQPLARHRDPLSLSITGDVAIDRGAASWVGGSATACARLSVFCMGATGHLRSGASGGRSDAALLAMIEIPISFGHVVLAPGIGGGGGSSALDMEGQQDSHVGLRAEARATVSYPLGRRVLVDLVIAGEASPWAEDSQNQDSSASESEPDLMLRFGVGLRIGAR